MLLLRRGGQQLGSLDVAAPLQVLHGLDLDEAAGWAASAVLLVIEALGL